MFETYKKITLSGKNIIKTNCAVTYRHFIAYHFVHDLREMPWSDIAKRTNVDDALDAWMSCFVGVRWEHYNVW